MFDGLSDVTEWTHAINVDRMFAYVHDDFGNRVRVEVSRMDIVTRTQPTLIAEMHSRIARRRLVIAAYRYDGQAE